jgi:hypothetical protein
MNNDAMIKNFSAILALLPDDLPETEKAEAERIRGNLKNLSGVEKDPRKETERQEHKKALAEVYYIINHMDEGTLARIPLSFKKFLEEQKWENYVPKDLSHLREEACSLLDTVNRHFLSADEEKPQLQLKYYIESCLHMLSTSKQHSPSQIIECTQALQRVATLGELKEVAAACGLGDHLRFIMEKEEKITLLFS